MRKRQIWASELYLGEIRGDARRSTFYSPYNRTFSLSFTVPELWGEMCTARLFSQGGRPLCTQILPGQGSPPATILDIRKLETLGYPSVKTASLCVPSFWHNTGVWWTDLGTDAFAVAYRLQRLQSYSVTHLTAITTHTHVPSWNAFTHFTPIRLTSYAVLPSMLDNLQVCLRAYALLHWPDDVALYKQLFGFLGTRRSDDRNSNL